jgi:glycogen operon protein
VLSRVKLIAEPWDVGPGGYQVGNFPVLWAEWNAAFRDDIRDFWRGEASLATFAQRFAGSSDLYADGRLPHASINFVTAHDGFTLADLVSYNEKHNEANLEDNEDGSDDNRSWNCGAEGPTAAEEILALRARQRRNLLVTLLLAQGVPMILGGDEMARTQQGNNNAWCQDNELSWLDWDNADEDLRAFAAHVIALRNREPVFRRREFLTGEDPATGVSDVTWLRPDAGAMSDDDWQREDTRALAVLLDGHEVPTTAATEDPVRGNSFLVLINAGHEPIDFTLPSTQPHQSWALELATGTIGDPAAEHDDFAEQVRLESRALVVLRECHRT